MWDVLHAIATIVSLILSFPAVAVCLLVLFAWHAKYVEYCNAINKTPSLTLIAGVYIGFSGSLGDNLWWGIAWSLDFVNVNNSGSIKYWRDFFFHNGVYPNIFFRQAALWIAGVLHLRAERMTREIHEMNLDQPHTESIAVKNRYKKALTLSFILGVIYAGFLIAIRSAA